MPIKQVKSFIQESLSGKRRVNLSSTGEGKIKITTATFFLKVKKKKHTQKKPATKHTSG